MTARSRRSVQQTLDDVCQSAKDNKDFEIVEQNILHRPSWLTEIPHERSWAVIHQVVYHGNVSQLNRLLVAQMKNLDFHLLSKTRDNKTVLDIVRQPETSEAMRQRIKRLVAMDELLNAARAHEWQKSKEILEGMPDIANEKPPYRKFYFVHHIASSGDAKVFDQFHRDYQLNLNLLTNDDQSIIDVANNGKHHQFVEHINSLKEQGQSPIPSDQFSPESRIKEQAHAVEEIAASESSQQDVPRLHHDETSAIASEAQSDLIRSLTCPLSGKLLRVPDGYTYERDNIEEYMKKHDYSPKTNELFKNKELQPNHTIEVILQSLLPASATSTYYRVQAGDTLTKIAGQHDCDLDQMKAANPELKDFDRLVPEQVIKLPLVQQLIDSSLKKEAPVSEHSITVFQHFDQSGSKPSLIPKCVPNQKLSDVREKLRAVFIQHDANKDGFVSLEEFKIFLSGLHLSIDDQDVNSLFAEISHQHPDKITFAEFYQYYGEMIKGEKSVHTQAEVDLLAAFLKADSEGKCELGGISQLINERWEKFNNFKRDGKTGKLVMVGGPQAKDILPGEYSLVDLITWSDIVPQDVKPKLIRVVNVRWTSSSTPASESGTLLFPHDFVDVRLPVELGTNDKLAYYGCCLANESQMKVSLLHRHAIQDFTYYPNYYDDYVKGRASLERHEFAHLDCPFEEDSGFFVLGKFHDSNESELHLTAFRIPLKHTLYVPPLTIHSNDYLKGTWRTMLSDATRIDHVRLERQRYDGEKDQIAFDFMK